MIKPAEIHYILVKEWERDRKLMLC
jgi:hypothetical protein